MTVAKKFLVGVGNVYGYNTSGDLLFQSKTMLDTAIDTKISSSQIKGGQGHKLQYIYYYGGELDLTLTETQWNLGMVAANIGTSIQTGKQVWEEESVTLGEGGTGSVTKTPVVTPDVTSTIYGWVTDSTGTTTKVTFTGKNFTLAGGTTGDIVTVRYFAQEDAAKYIDINADFVPSTIRLVIDAKLASSNTGDVTGSSIIGRAQVEVPRAQLDGTQTITMKSDGVAQTPLKASALEYTKSNGASIYATIAEIIDSAHWYDDVYALAIVDDSIELSSTTTTATLDVRAIPYQGSAFKPPYADLTFVSGTTATATIDANGIITKVAAGTSIITATITNKNTISAQADVTVTA